MATTTTFIDSADHLQAADANDKWIGSVGTAGSSITDTRFGVGRAWRDPNLRIPTITAVSAWAVGFAWRPSTYSADIAQLENAGLTKLILHYSSSGTLQLVRGTTVIAEGTERPKHGVWIYVEWATLLDSIVGSSQVKLNGGQADISFGRGDTSNGAGEVARGVQLGEAGAAGDFDDFYARAGASLSGTDLFGDTHVKAYYPTSDGNYTSWTPLGGGSHFSEVDDAQNDDDTTYVSSGTASNRDSYGFENLDSGGTVLAVQAVMRHKLESGAGTTTPFTRIGGTDFDGTAKTATITNYLSPPQVWELSPATSAAWTESEFNGAEFGVLKAS